MGALRVVKGRLWPARIAVRRGRRGSQVKGGAQRHRVRRRRRPRRGRSGLAHCAAPPGLDDCFDRLRPPHRDPGFTRSCVAIMRGSVSRRGSFWYYKFRGPADPLTGKRPWVSKGGFPTEKAAWKACRDTMKDADEGRFVPSTRRTLGTFLTEEWLPVINSSVKPTTWDNWRAYTDSYVVPIIGDIRLQQLSTPQLMTFYTRLLSEGRVKVDNNAAMYAYWAGRIQLGEDPGPRDLVAACGVSIHAARAAVRRFRSGRVPASLSPGLAPKTVRNIHVMLHRALTDAVNWRYLSRNPAADARPPKVTRQRRPVWTPEQLRTFLQHSRGDRFYPLYLLATTTGMRRAELCGICWSAVDLVDRTLSVQEGRVVVAGHAANSRFEPAPVGLWEGPDLPARCSPFGVLPAQSRRP